MKIKILAALFTALFAVQAGFAFAGSSVSAADTTIKDEATCIGAGGYWQSNSRGADKCVTRNYESDDEACEEAKGTPVSIDPGDGKYRDYCEVIVDSEGSLITDLGRPSATYENPKCNILSDDICNAMDNEELGDSAIWQIVLTVITILTGGVGVLALAGIVYGSVLYSSAGGNPEQVKKAKNVIVNVVIGIIAFALMWSLLQWVVPGGVFE